MHTAFLRGNVVLFTAIGVLFVAALGCGSQYFLELPTFPCNLQQPTITRFRQSYRPSQGYEHAYGTFHLDADLRPVWNWNTGQLFVYVSVEWEGTKHKNNSQVIWDRIIQHEKDARINSLMDFEYTINDQYAQLKGAQLRVELHYDIMPVVGILKTVAAPQCSTTLTMPKNYIM